MRKSHEILLKLYHAPEYQFDKVEIEYVDRGAPDDKSIVSAYEIVKLDPQYIEVDAGTHIKYIPYHRLRRIAYDGVDKWRKKER